jgi:hypothetical protein
MSFLRLISLTPDSITPRLAATIQEVDLAFNKPA